VFTNKTNEKYYNRIYFRVTAGTLVVVMLLVAFLQAGTMVVIGRSEDNYNTAENYLVDNTEYVNKSRPSRMIDYIETFNTKETLEYYYKLAGTQIAKEKYDLALESIEKCIGLYENEGQEFYMDLLLKRGSLQVMIGDYDAALKSLEIALNEDSEVADIYLVKAQIYSELQDMVLLEQCLLAYLDLKPEDNDIRELLAQIQFKKDDYQIADQQNDEKLITDVESEVGTATTISIAETEYIEGLNAVKNSNFLTAEAYLTSAILKDDSFEGIYYYRGVCNMSLEKYLLAIEDLTISIDKEDMQQASYYTRGVCLLMDNQYEKGFLDIEYASNLNEDEEITKQAQLLIEELEKAQIKQAVNPEGIENVEETANPEEIIKPEETVMLEEIEEQQDTEKPEENEDYLKTPLIEVTLPLETEQNLNN